MNWNILPLPMQMEATGEQPCIAETSLILSEPLKQFVKKAEELFPGKGTLPIRLNLSEDYGKEEYRLEVRPDGVKITASAPNGAYYALTTLSQLFRLNGGSVCPLRIHDRPDMPLRGISDDISRGQISTLDNFKEIIRRMAYVKCNVYMPYIEDTFAFRKFPESGKYSDPVPQEEWKELIAYAKDYYIDLIPVFNTLGHWDKNAKLDAFAPYVMKENDDPAGQPCSSVDIRRPESRQMICDMLDELADVFGESGAIHVGGDEVGDYTRIFKKDLAEKYYNEHFNRMYDYLAAKGLKTFMYSDMYTPLYGDYSLGIDFIDEMPADMNFVFWDYACRGDYPNIRSLIERKKKFCISPATYTWNRMLPHHYCSWLNTKLLAQHGNRQAQGLIMSAWCDGGMTLREENWTGIYTGALYAWNCGNPLTFEEVISSYFRLFFGLEINLDQYRALMNYDRRAVPEVYDPKQYDGKIEFWYDKRQALGSAFFSEFWKDATEPADSDLKEKLAGSAELFADAYAYFSGLKPVHNAEAYRVFLFDIKRSLIAARKLEILPDRPFRSREEARAKIPEIDWMTKALEALKEENRERWFASNRQSEWDFVEAKYDDLIDSFHALKRCCLYGKRLDNRKKL